MTDVMPPYTPQHEDGSILDKLHLLVSATVELGSQVKKQTEENAKVWNRMQYNTPVLYRMAASGVANASGTVQLVIGSPDTGTYWDVENIAVGGTDYNVAVAGSAGVYISGAMIGTTSPGMNSLQDYTATLPNVAFYGLRDMVVQDGENLFLLVKGGTSGVTYVASVDISVYNVATGTGKTMNIAGM